MPFSLTTLFILPVIYWRKGRITSSRHDPYGLGYTRVTMVVTKGSNGANRSESLKTTLFRLFSAIREHEDGITSNRGSARHGEIVPGPCTPRPSRSEN